MNTPGTPAGNPLTSDGQKKRNPPAYNNVNTQANHNHDINKPGTWAGNPLTSDGQKKRRDTIMAIRIYRKKRQEKRHPIA